MSKKPAYPLRSEASWRGRPARRNAQAFVGEAKEVIHRQNI